MNANLVYIQSRPKYRWSPRQHFVRTDPGPGRYISFTCAPRRGLSLAASRGRRGVKRVSSGGTRDLDSPIVDDSSIQKDRDAWRVFSVNARLILRMFFRKIPFIGKRQIFVGILNILLVFLIRKLLNVVSAGQIELFYLYYQPLVPFLMMLWGWGINVLYFEKTGLRYDMCFEERDRSYLLHSVEILKMCNTLSCGLLSSASLFLMFTASGMLRAAALQPVLLYMVTLLVLVMPFPIFYRDTRRYFATTFWRVLTPVRSVAWGDFLLADILTSLAKGLSDIERAICSMVSGPILSGTPEQCTDASWIIPIGLVMPYFWRFIQCIRVYIDTGNKQQLWNALKYMTAFPVVFLSFSKYHVAHDSWVSVWKPLWLLAACVNSGFSYFWDIERDWEISFFSQIGSHKRLHARTILPQPTNFSRRTYYYLMISNLMLRLSWTYKLSPHLRRDHLIVFCIVLLEAFRRFQWIFIRIEVELRKLQKLQPELGVLVPSRGNARKQHVSITSPKVLPG
eukprot:jgi/Picre1/29676/NNA_005059.t1